MEAVISTVLLTEREYIPIRQQLIDSLIGLGMGRIFMFGLMVALLARREYQLRSERGSTDEGQSLLENGDGPPNGYGPINHGSSTSAARKDQGTRTLSWLDYIASFQVLFPYLW